MFAFAKNFKKNLLQNYIKSPKLLTAKYLSTVKPSAYYIAINSTKLSVLKIRENRVIIYKNFIGENLEKRVLFLRVSQKCHNMSYEFKNLKKVKLVNGRVGISFFYDNKRYRYFNGKAIDANFQPNTCKENLKDKQLELMLQAFSEKLEKGWRPKKEIKPKMIKPIDINLYEAITLAFEQKKKMEYSLRYKKDLTSAYNKIIEYLILKDYKRLLLSEFDVSIIKDLLNHISSSKRVQLNYKQNYSSLLTEYFEKYKLTNPFRIIKLVKQEEVLHKPIKDIKLVFEELRVTNTNLHICCLLAYGCLLRPHREIRNLKWGDFNDDCSFISLSGAQNKGKKNRIVPIPKFVQQHLKKRNEKHNIFTDSLQVYNEDYFKTLWGRYKKESALIKEHNTLYSFRHTGAINVYEKTGSLSKLQQVMGHRSLNTSLTYLRGLGVKQLTVEDMPELM
ncbi:tyrosine-type recombinase/integrase [Flavobacterium lacustre]|uniref:tyrosine-type recombinase/integrase n=1 Tax=Flavobacterium lacustre TaxID=3016339 RepID=UPI0022B70104|nr:site-specific integrase [Flavobacterium lacustre]